MEKDGIMGTCVSCARQLAEGWLELGTDSPSLYSHAYQKSVRTEKKKRIFHENEQQGLRKAMEGEKEFRC